MKIIFMILFLSLINLGTPLLAKDISPKINGKLKDECAYIVGLLERVIKEASFYKPDEADIKGGTTYHDGELIELEYLNPKNTALVKTYLDLCK